MKYLVIAVVTTMLGLALASTATAETHGWGLGVGSMDGDFGVQGRKDIHLGGDISHIIAQASLIFCQ